MTDAVGRAVACGVWWATASTSSALTGLLDAPERRRAEGLRRRGSREQFVTARALLRLLLSERVGVPAAEITLDVTCHRCGADHGKPRLVGARSGEGPSFNVAHAGERVAVVVTDGVDVGIDIEAVETAEALTVGSILSPAELTDYARLPVPARARALAVWWTRKESLLKATGDGLALPMADVAVTAPDLPAALRDGSGSSRTAMAALRDIARGDGVVGCVAALGAASLEVTEHDGDALLASPMTRTPRRAR